MKIKHLIIALACSLSLGACSASQTGSVIDTAGTVCSVIVAATDPKLASLCTTAEAIADAVAALTLSYHTEASDAGVRAASLPYEPSNDDVYLYLANHGAKEVKKR